MQGPRQGSPIRNCSRTKGVVDRMEGCMAAWALQDGTRELQATARHVSQDVKEDPKGQSERRRLPFNT